MEIIVGKNAGFCFGVKNAVAKTTKALDENKKVYCLGELVHNKQVTDELINKGANFIDKIEDSRGLTIIRAHGVKKEIYEIVQKLNIEIEDLTCPKVLHIHNIAEEHASQNYFIFLVGKKDHPETIGTKSFCGENSTIIEKLEDVKTSVEQFEKSKLQKALVIAQTTISLEKFNQIIEKLQEKIENIEIKNTICAVTKQRQEETEKISEEVQLMIIVGSKHSSNATKLYEIAKNKCKNALFVETKDELDLEYVREFNKIGIMAGASTPQKSIDELVDIIQKTC